MERTHGSCVSQSSTVFVEYYVSTRVALMLNMQHKLVTGFVRYTYVVIKLMQCIWSAWGESTMCGSVYVSIFRYVSSEGGQYCFSIKCFAVVVMCASYMRAVCIHSVCK